MKNLIIPFLKMQIIMHKIIYQNLEKQVELELKIGIYDFVLII